MPRPPFILIILTLLSSCSAARKFDFRSAYKFKYLQYKEIIAGDSIPRMLASANEFKYIPGSETDHTKIEEINTLNKVSLKNDHDQLNGPVQNRSKSGIKPVPSQFSTRNPYSIKSIRKINEIDKINRRLGFRDLHPALQGFFFVAIGFGIVLIGVLLGDIQIIPTVLIIAGFILVAFGFYKILSQL